MNSFEVVVIGAGPSGAFAAYNLAKQGISVAILDKASLPRYKTCGGGIVYRARKLLPFDISEVVERECHQVELNFVKENLSFNHKNTKPVVSMVMRDKFDYLIVNKAKELGAKLFQNTKVLDIQQTKDAVQLKTSNNDFQAKYVIAADGALNQTAKKLGCSYKMKSFSALEAEIETDKATFECYSKSGRIDLDYVPRGYAWVFPKKNHLSLGLGGLGKSINLNLALKQYIEYLGITKIHKIEIHGSMIPTSNSERILSRDRVLFVGDTVSLADPITAEGITNALSSGKIAAEAIVEGSFHIEEVKSLYKKRMKTEILNNLIISDVFHKLIYFYPTLRSSMFRKYGQIFIDKMCAIFMGELSFQDIKKGVTFKKVVDKMKLNISDP